MRVTSARTTGPIFFLIALLLGTADSWQDAARAAEPADATGTWRWSFTTPQGQTIDMELILKLEGEELTGTIAKRGSRGSKIEKVNLKGEELSFEVTRKRSGTERIVRYQAKLEGDVLKGKVEAGTDDDKTTHDWEAKREKK